MRTLITVFAVLFSLSVAAQKECKCLENTYDVPGEITFVDKTDDNNYVEHYAGVVDGMAQMTALYYSDGKLSRISYYRIPAKDVNWEMNNMFASYSSKETKKTTSGVEYIQLTLGNSFNGAKTAQWGGDSCSQINMPSLQKGKSSAWGSFKDAETVVKFTDQVRAAQKAAE